jgi:ABC-type phosphate/phosphonate transport system substrate-binding protein
MIANARMYAVGPRAAAAWRTLLAWVIARAGVECEIVLHPPPLPLAALWARGDLGCALMCGYPLVRATPSPVVLAAPVPSPAAYGGRAMYWTDLVVRADSRFATLEHLFGRRIAWTTPDSQSGYHALRALFAPYAAARGTPLFAATVGPLVTPRAVVAAVLDGTADAGPLDSYWHDLLRAHEPDVAARLRTLVTTAPGPMPAFVGASTLAAADAKRLSAALMAVAAAPELAAARAALLLAGFAPRTTADYAILAHRAAEADALGYARLA